MAVSVTIRVGSADDIQFNILQNRSAMNLTGYDVELYLIDGAGNTKSFATTDVSPKLTFVDEPGGIVKLSYATTDFTAVNTWNGYFWLTKDNYKFSAPESDEISIKVIA